MKADALASDPDFSICNGCLSTDDSRRRVLPSYGTDPWKLLLPFHVVAPGTPRQDIRASAAF